MTMMDSEEIIASCDLEFGLYSKLNERLSVIKVKVCSVILIRFCMFCAYTRPIYQMSVYMTIVLWF